VVAGRDFHPAAQFAPRAPAITPRLYIYLRMESIRGDEGLRGVCPEPRLEAGAGRLSAASKARLALEVLAAYGQARWRLRGASLPEVVEVLRGCRPAGGRPLPDPARDGARVARAAVRVLEPLPLDARCLLRSLVLLRLLARRGARAELRIAVAKAGSAGLEAHAWVELDGSALLPPAQDGYHHLTTL
jgi:hypothetical protein